MSTTKELILNDMRTLTAKGNPVVTAPQLASLLKRPTPSLRRNLAELVTKGLVRRDGQGYVLSGVKRLAVATARVATPAVEQPQPATPPPPPTPPVPTDMPIETEEDLERAIAEEAQAGMAPAGEDITFVDDDDDLDDGEGKIN